MYKTHDSTDATGRAVGVWNYSLSPDSPPCDLGCDAYAFGRNIPPAVILASRVIQLCRTTTVLSADNLQCTGSLVQLHRRIRAALYRKDLTSKEHPYVKRDSHHVELTRRCTHRLLFVTKAKYNKLTDAAHVRM